MSLDAEQQREPLFPGQLFQVEPTFHAFHRPWYGGSGYLLKFIEDVLCIILVVPVVLHQKTDNHGPLDFIRFGAQTPEFGRGGKSQQIQEEVLDVLLQM